MIDIWWNESKLAKLHIHINNLIKNILITEVAFPRSLMVSLRSPHATILLKLYKYYILSG